MGKRVKTEGSTTGNNSKNRRDEEDKINNGKGKNKVTSTNDESSTDDTSSDSTTPDPGDPSLLPPPPEPKVEVDVFKRLRKDLDRKEELDEEEYIVNRKLKQMNKESSGLKKLFKGLKRNKLLRKKAIPKYESKIEQEEKEIRKLFNIKDKIEKEEKTVEKDIREMNEVIERNKLNYSGFRLFKKKKTNKKQIIDELKKMYEEAEEKNKKVQ